MIEQTIDAAATIIMKWDADTSAYAKVTSLFYESKREALRFIRSVNELQKTMHLLVSEQDSGSEKLVRAQILMQTAMKRLQKEFYQILSMNRAHLDPESVSTRSSRTSARSSTSDFDDDDEIRTAGDSISEIEEVSSMAMSDLKLIADCMIASGYAKECMHIYKIIRKSIIDEEAEKISMRTLFTGERILCDQVFATSDLIKESCFTEISKEAAILLFGFPELVAKTKKYSQEKMFRVLDMYSAISEDWKEIETIFSFESTSTVRLQALDSLVRLSESVRSLLMDFESTIQKDSSKTMIPGGGLHPLTISSMNYLTLLADYSNILTDIILGLATTGEINITGFFLIRSRLRRFNGAGDFRPLCLAHPRLTLQTRRVRTSNLQYILGEEWITKHEAKVKQFTSNYEPLAWGEVFASLPDNPTAPITAGKAKDCFRKFNASFENAYWKQRSCIVPDSELREEIKASIATKLVTLYRDFYNTQISTVGDERSARLFVRFSPEDIGNYLSDLFYGTVSSGSSSTSSSVSSHHRRKMLRSPLRV
ncbi:hypothetical protein GOBAR_AA17112 [Gossypium barbadense]|uniref:Exocyst subunit Exo70 family protein n=1 Tax=Gossypium barbadense TaxID=3634 RepID=A0A2P5XJP1_GOSBA|nr:hypothetical protein GOBAR_AA17112 [Gossypium barbadense]